MFQEYQINQQMLLLQPQILQLKWWFWMVLLWDQHIVLQTIVLQSFYLPMKRHFALHMLLNLEINVALLVAEIQKSKIHRHVLNTSKNGLNINNHKQNQIY